MSSSQKNLDQFEVVWRPQAGPQTALIACPTHEVFFGGARGGGKTDGMLGDWLEHQQTWGKGAIGVFFRRTLPQLSEVMSRAHEIFTPLGARWHEQKKRFLFPNGARLAFRYLERDKDAENYQGHSYTRLYIEEATNFPSPAPIDKLRATLRSTRVPQEAWGLRLTGNPGGPGHGWVKHRYIDPAPLGYQILRENWINPFNGKGLITERVFIPSKLSDNKLLMDGNPMYAAQLQQAGSKQLVEAWLFGKWDIIDGAFFSEFDPLIHVLPGDWIERVPKSSLVFRAFDWGYAKPFSCGWYAVADGTWGPPRGAMVKILEWYGCTGRPNEGIRLDAPLVAEGVKERDLDLQRQYGLKVRYGVADPSIFTRDGGPSIAELMLSKNITWGRADNKRLAGWQSMRTRMRVRAGQAGLYFLETCADTIRTLPTMQHDDKNVEDLDTDGEDHAVDETRYATMSRPWVIDEAKNDEIDWKNIRALPTINELLASNRKKRLAESTTPW
jgi:hypothetical protein